MDILPISAECADIVEKILSTALKSQRTPVCGANRPFVNVEFNGMRAELRVVITNYFVDADPDKAFMSDRIYPLCAREDLTYKEVYSGLVQAYDVVRRVLST